jgi:hypothetical protein
MVLTGLGDYTAGLRASSEAVELARTLHNDWRLAFTLMMLGNNIVVLQGLEAARPAFEESLRLARAVGDPWLLSQAVYTLAVVASLTGDSPSALRLFDESIGNAQVVVGACHILWPASARVSARRPDRSGQAAAWTKPDTCPWCQYDEHGACAGGICWMAAARGQPVRTAQSIGAADSVMAAIDARWWPTEQFAYDFIATMIRALLDEATWDAAYAEGRTMTVDQAIAYALKETDA